MYTITYTKYILNYIKVMNQLLVLAFLKICKLNLVARCRVELVHEDPKSNTRQSVTVSTEPQALAVGVSAV